MPTFRLVSWYWYPAVLLGMGSNYVVGFQPSLVPYDYLGPVGVFLHYMAYDLNTLIKLLFIGGCVAHIAESLYALYLCRKANFCLSDQFLWTFQTFIVGFSSLGVLKGIVKKRQS